MKANDAPEKLYIDLFKGEFNVGRSPVNNSVEYVRKDAFIEKACEYLQEHLIDYWSQSVTNESKFIDEFIDYMKGK